MPNIFNENNNEWQTGQGSLILGQRPALYDSINVRHPELFALYKLQKSIDWAENEINLEQSRMDLLTCGDAIRDIMLENIAFQWEADSIAARTITPLFAPFVTNSELWAALSKNAEIENLHALTYSEIVRQCIPNPQDVFKRVMYNENVLNRMSVVSKVFNDLSVAGAKYTLGLIENDQELYNIVFKGFVALYALERIQFGASFAATFAVVEQLIFQGIGKLVQKIMQDEFGVHAKVDLYVLKHEMTTPRGKRAMEMCYDEICQILLDVKNNEHAFARHLFSNGRSIVGLNVTLLDQWIDYNAYHVTTSFMPSSFVLGSPENPLKYMDDWLDLDKFQNAQQEGDGNNYTLNVVVDDLSDDIFEI